jgi:Transposase
VLKRSSKSKGGRYPTAFTLKAIKRVERGEGVLPVARDLGVTRKALHDWMRACKAIGSEGLNRKRAGAATAWALKDHLASTRLTIFMPGGSRPPRAMTTAPSASP